MLKLFLFGVVLPQRLFPKERRESDSVLVLNDGGSSAFRAFGEGAPWRAVLRRRPNFVPTSTILLLG